MTEPAAATAPGASRTIAERWTALPGNLRGAGWMVLSAAVFASQGVTVKWLGTRLDVFEIAFFRCLVGLATILPFIIGPALAHGSAALVLTGRPWLHVARAVVGVSGMFCGFYSVTHLPLATATAISFTKPLFLIVLAVVFLGEPVRWRRWTATAAGFAGVLFVVRPGGDAFNLAALLGLLGAMLIADVVVLVKKLSASERNVTILFYFTLITTLVSAIPAVFVWRAPTRYELGLLVLVGVLATLGQWCSLRAYRVGEATAVMPFDYIRLLFAGLYGFALFAEVPDLLSLAGAAILIVSTLYIGYRELRLNTGPADRTPAG